MVHGASDRIRKLLCWRKVAGSVLGVNKPFLKDNAYRINHMGRLTGFEGFFADAKSQVRLFVSMKQTSGERYQQ